jgi:act minimal PKS acyl carrier protein
MSARIITAEELFGLLQQAAGAGTQVEFEGEPVDVPFADLGYDSLALLETATLIKLRFGITVDDDIAGAQTPREYLEQVNQVGTAAS